MRREEPARCRRSQARIPRTSLLDLCERFFFCDATINHRIAINIWARGSRLGTPGTGVRTSCRHVFVKFITLKKIFLNLMPLPCRSALVLAIDPGAALHYAHTCFVLARPRLFSLAPLARCTVARECAALQIIDTH